MQYKLTVKSVLRLIREYCFISNCNDAKSPYHVCLNGEFHDLSIFACIKNFDGPRQADLGFAIFTILRLRKKSGIRKSKDRISKLILEEPVTISSHQNCPQSEFRWTSWSFCNRRKTEQPGGTLCYCYIMSGLNLSFSRSQCAKTLPPPFLGVYLGVKTSEVFLCL